MLFHIMRTYRIIHGTYVYDSFDVSLPCMLSSSFLFIPPAFLSLVFPGLFTVLLFLDMLLCYSFSWSDSTVFLAGKVLIQMNKNGNITETLRHNKCCLKKLEKREEGVFIFILKWVVFQCMLVNLVK